MSAMEHDMFLVFLDISNNILFEILTDSGEVQLELWYIFTASQSMQ